MRNIAWSLGRIKLCQVKNKNPECKDLPKALKIRDFFAMLIVSCFYLIEPLVAVDEKVWIASLIFFSSAAGVG